MGLSGGSVPAAPRSGAYLLIRFGPTPLDDPFGRFTQSAQCRRPHTCAAIFVIKDTRGPKWSRDIRLDK
jgi:hypothetical protein